MIDGPILFLDTETFSPTPIRDGTHRYAEPAEVMIASWALDDPLFGEGEIIVEDLTDADGIGCLSLSPELQALIDDPTIPIVMHNSAFDRTLLHIARGITINPDRIECTMVRAMSHGLPGGLDKLSYIFKLGDDAKHEGGRELIRLFCMSAPKNQKLRRRTKNTHPEEWDRFLSYAGGDIRSMRALRRKLPSWNYSRDLQGNHWKPEYEAWLLDQTINDRGFHVDLDLATAAVEMMAHVKTRYDEYVEDVTWGEVQSTTQRDLLLKHLLREYGVDLPDMQKATLERRIDDPNLPMIVRELLSTRLDQSMASPAKYKALLRSVSSDGRLRGTLQFCGAARTGRWAGRIFQPQNLIRTPDSFTAAVQEESVNAIKAGVGDLMLDNPSKHAAYCMRGAIIAAPGHKLIEADLSGIEARVLPWLAGEDWKLQAFRDYDAGTGPDIYRSTAGRLLGRAPESVTKDERQSHGKVPELSCFGPDTQVLTNHGIKAIVEVALSDLLWDGVEWVAHQGILDRGRKQVLFVDGVAVTSDHLFLSERGWASASMVASSPSIHSSCRAIGSASLPWYATREDRKEDLRASSSSAIAAQNPISLTLAISGPDVAVAASCVQERRKLQPQRSGGDTLISCQMSSIAEDYAAGSQLASVGAIIRKTKHSGTTEAEALPCFKNGATIAASFSHTSSRLRAGIIRFWSWIARMSIKATPPETYASSPNSRTLATKEACTISNNGSLFLSNVFDIANAGPRNRFTILSDTGAYIVHNCGYQGSVAALFATARLYNFDIDEDQARAIVEGWREENPAIKRFWYELDDAAREAILSPDRVVKVGEHIAFHRWREWLRMRLPSGRVLCYCQPALVPHPKFGGQSISYLGVNNYTRRWERLHTYGGKFAAEATQGTARDILAANAPAIEEAGYRPVLSIHDAFLCEPLDDPRFTTSELCALLARHPDWTDERLPLTANGFEAYRYRK